MKNKLQQFIVKLLAATLAIIMAVPTNVFAMSQRKSNTYTAATSVMGIQTKDDAPQEVADTETSLLKSAVSTEESTDYIIEKSASLSKTTGKLDYKIVLKTKDPSKEFTENQTTTFAITENTDLKDLKVEKVQALDANSKETDLKYTVNTPKLFNNTDNLRTLGLTATKPQYGMVYYLSAQLTEEALKNLEEKSPQLALDITIASPNQDIFQTRYSLETTKPDTTQITIDNDNNVVNQTEELVEKEDNLHLYKGEYKKEEKSLFQTTPAHLVWTDYINAKDDKEFTINFDLDENQDTENSQIKIDYYEAQDKGYILNQSFSKTVDFTNSLNLTIPQGYIAKVSLTTGIKENTNTKEYTFNGVKVANPTYKEETSEETEEEQASDDADPLPSDSSKKDEEAKPSNDSVADESDQDFSQSPKSDTSAIALNKDAYLENLRNEEKLTENLEKATNDIELALESYNKEETNWDEFKIAIQNIAKEQNLDQAQTEETLQALLAGLNEDKYKVANIDIKEATGVVEESTDESNPADTTEKSVDELAKAKLNEEGITIEDFQNYMYELEEKYGLTDEDAARIYGDNAEAIQALVNKAQEEKTTGDVFAVDTSNTRALNKAYPYNLHYFSYSYLKDGKVNWDIQIHTDELKAINDINYDNLYLNLYAPVDQGLTDYKISVSSSPDNFRKDITDTNTKKGKVVYKDGTTSSLSNYSDTTGRVYEDLSNGKFSNYNSNETINYNKKISRGEIPDIIFVHVEATPSSTDPKSTSYDLGLRLTPDNNYIYDLIVDFQDQWNQLISAIPWIIPYKSGEAAAAKFAKGFNLVDTRVPAKVTGLNDDVYERYDYMDKSRSVFGTLDENINTVNWHISDTIRLQDDQSQLGDDIFSASFTGNTNTANPYVEVLSPNDNGGYDKIISTNNINSGSALRSAINSNDPSNPGLKPGTIINYVYNNTSNNIYGRNTITVPFSQRFDDGVGYYGGEKTASIRMFTKEEQNEMYHLAIQINDVKSNADKGNYLYNTAKTGWTNVDTRQTIYDNPLNAGNWRILENYDMVVCLNPGYKTPLNKSDFFNETRDRELPSTYFKKTSVTKAEDIKPFLRKSNQGDYQNLYKEIQKIFFYLEEVKEENNFNDSEIAGILQAAIFDAEGKITGAYSDILYITQSDLDNYKDYLKPKLSNEITEEERNSVDMNIYYINYANNNQWQDSKGNNGEYQNLITGKVQKPVTLSKEFINDRYTGINGSANFEVVSEDGTYNKSFSLSNNQETKLYLEPGIYTIKETSTASGYNTLKDITIRVYDDRIKIKNNDIPLAVDMKSVNLGLPYGFSKNDRPNRYYIEDGELIEWGNNTVFYNNPPYEHYNEEIFRENTSYNNKKYIGSSDQIKHIDYGDKSNGIVGGNYDQTFRKVEIIENPNDNKFTKLSNLSLKAINDKSDNGKFKVYKQFKNANGVMVPLREITFNLYKDGDSDIYQTRKTGFDGYAIFKDLPSGRYTLKEEQFPGLEKLDQEFDVVVENGNTTISAKNNNSLKTEDFEILNNDGVVKITNKPETPVYGNFKIIKVNEDNPTETLSGATFVLKDESGITREVSTDDQGTISFDNLKPGNYTLKETKAPNEYQVDPTNDTWTVTVDKDTGDVTIKDESGKSQSGNTLKYEIKNKKVPSYEFKLKKVSEDNPEIVIEGAEFTLTGPDPSTESITRKTDANGVISFEDLKSGSYQLIEKNPAPGYYKSDKTWTVTITNDGEAYYRENSRSNVVKDDIDEIERYSDSSIASDKNHKIFNLASIIDLFSIPEAYAASSGWEKVDSERSNPVTQSSDEVKTKITEVNKSTKQFKQIFLIDGNKNNQNNDFNLNIKRVPSGSLDQNQVSVRVFTVDSSSTVDNLINPGTNLNLQGVTNDNNYTGEVKIRFNGTGNKGFSKANIFAIEVTTSYNQSSPLGLKMDYFHTRSGAQSNWKSYTGSQYYTSENEINKAIKGEVRGYEDTAIPITTSTKDDPNLDSGQTKIVEGTEGIKRTYYIYETENGVRTGVKRIDTSKGTNGVEIIKQMTPTIKYIGTKPLGPEQKASTFTRNRTIDYETETTQDPSLNMGEKEVVQRGVKGTVTNEYSITYEKSSGADAPKIKDGPSDKDIEDNRPGDGWRAIAYNVTELSKTPPTKEVVKVGTKYVKQSGDISVRENNGYAIITNKPIEFKIIKSNSGGEKLSGAEFTLYTNENATQEISIKDVPPTVKTENDGIATFKALPANIYYLKETKAPNGYVPLSKIWKIVVSKDGVTIDEENVEGKYSIVLQTETDSATLKVINNQPTYPSTGGSGTFIGFALIGTAIMLAGIAYYGIYVNDKNRRRSNRYGK